MRFRTGVSRDGRITGMDLQTLLDGGAYGSYGVASTFYTGALQTVTYQIPTLPLPRLPHLHQQAAVRPQARPRHAAAALRPGGAARQDRRARCSIDPAELRLGMIAPPRHADRQLPAHRHHRPGASASTAWSSAPAGARSTASSPYGRGLGLACSSYLSGAGPADLLERPAALGRAAASSIAAAASPRSAAPPRSARAPTTCWWTAWPRCWASIRSTSARSPATPTSRRSTSAPTPAASR